MPQSKAAPKERYERQRESRRLRRSLAALTPGDCHPQAQSLIFAALPGELRFMIFQLVLSQQSNSSRPVDFHSISPLWRPGHTHHNVIDFRLLLTCRLVYYEARAIPLRSATHHFRYLGSTSWLYNGDVWLHHVTKQRGAELYHLHDNLVALSPENFSKFLLPHLHWRRITWTICGYLFPPILASQRQMDRIAQTLLSLELPASCQEVNLEFETRQDLLQDWPDMRQRIQKCQEIALSKVDGTQLQIDPRYVVRYEWHGSGEARWGSGGTTRPKHTMLYFTTRLCWRAPVPRRDYTSYDHLDCLRLDDCASIVKCISVSQRGNASIK